MPEYSFLCSRKTCKHKFNQICSFKDFDEKFVNVECPKCRKKKPKRVDINNVNFINSSDKMNNFSYAAEKNFEKAQTESSAAREEAKKKGITSPYADLPDFTDNGNRMNFID